MYIYNTDVLNNTVTTYMNIVMSQYNRFYIDYRKNVLISLVYEYKMDNRN